LPVALKSFDVPDAACRLWSLWDIMNHFEAKELLKRLAEFASLQVEAKALDGRTKSLDTIRADLTKSLSGALDVVRAIRSREQRARPGCEPNIFSESTSVFERKQKRMREPLAASALVEIADESWHALVRDLDKLKYLYVSVDFAGCLDQERLFGNAVYDNFPTARDDIRDAGSCIAAEQGTAAVFHLMRASEVALRALCRDRGKTYPDSSLEARQVGDLLGALDTEVNQMRATDWKNWSSKDVKDAQVNFYHQALVEFRDFNEAWRKHMAHGHEGTFYNADTAIGILRHVKGLMQVLAEKISETTVTPKYWVSV
jgi:hypothetical protein